ncbi:hypothetical protein AWB78_04046 [Caballeronia calidae]|uniref:Uncharacterized protein n=1 Tax=Caballeronia calidae TaxID=1777139 RepID=A0A158CK66_9BURK|nr:hypothetical protein [Caballeronia calidae]SAK82763.1 hypothetical protein AWB78_04046 [Caballeronia calidae]
MCRVLLVLLAFCANATAADDRYQRRHHGNGEPRLPVVYDAQGKAVGFLEVYSGASGVFLNIEGRPVFLASVRPVAVKGWIESWRLSPTGNLGEM